MFIICCLCCQPIQHFQQFVQYYLPPLLCRLVDSKAGVVCEAETSGTSSLLVKYKWRKSRTVMWAQCILGLRSICRIEKIKTNRFEVSTLKQTTVYPEIWNKMGSVFFCSYHTFISQKQMLHCCWCLPRKGPAAEVVLYAYQSKNWLAMKNLCCWNFPYLNWFRKSLENASCRLFTANFESPKLIKSWPCLCTRLA